VEQAAIAELLRPYANLSAVHLRNTSIYIDLLVKWNSKINLTAVRDPKEIVTRHFGESFFAASHLLAPQWTGTVIDVGSGAGFPGLPLAMYAPGACVTLIESHGKKAAFLNEVIFALQLENAKVFRGRAESFSGVADIVTMRAVERFESAVPIGLKLVGPGGRLALMIGAAQVAKAKELAPALIWDPPVPMPGGSSRVLLLGTK
jgi:16S rRNA (guanine527-N7)-methyltransferase